MPRLGKKHHVRPTPEQFDMSNNLDVFKISRADREQLIWAMPELREGHIELCEQQGFKTGSEVYGGARDRSDIDYVVQVNPSAFAGYCLNVGNKGYWEADGMQVLYGHYDGKPINIICMSDANLYKAWYQATEYMKHLNEAEVQIEPGTGYWECPLADRIDDSKYSRVRMFRSLVDALYPVVQKPRSEWLTVDTARKISRCKACHREARNFSNHDLLKEFLKDGFCERCREMNL